MNSQAQEGWDAAVQTDRGPAAGAAMSRWRPCRKWGRVPRPSGPRSSAENGDVAVTALRIAPDVAGVRQRAPADARPVQDRHRAAAAVAAPQQPALLPDLLDRRVARRTGK